jgi:plastocyanin
MPRLALALVLMGGLVLAACSASDGGSTSATSTSGLPVGGTVTLGSGSFAQTRLTISAGQAVRLLDPTQTGGTHRLCLGADGHCDTGAQGPDELHDPGLLLMPGDTKDIGFASAGQYQVTCTIHPSMNLTVSVLGTGR